MRLVRSIRLPVNFMRTENFEYKSICLAGLEYYTFKIFFCKIHTFNKSRVFDYYYAKVKFSGNIGIAYCPEHRLPTRWGICWPVC